MNDLTFNMDRLHVLGLSVAGSGPLIAEHLRGSGLSVTWCHVLRVVPPEDIHSFDAVARGVNDCDWLVLTSRNAALAIRGMLRRHELSPSQFAPRQIAVVGASTADTVRDLGWHVDLVPDRQDAKGLAEALCERRGSEPQRVYLPQSSLAEDDLDRDLRACGYDTVRFQAYRLSVDQTELERAGAEAATADCILVTSPSVAVLAADLPTKLGVSWITLGPRTSIECERLNLTPVFTAETPNAAGVLEATRRALRPT